MIIIFIFFVILIVFIPLLNLRLVIKIIIKDKHNRSSFNISLLKGLINLRLNFSLEGIKKGIISLLSGKKDLDVEHLYSIEDIYHFFSEQLQNYEDYKIYIKNLGAKMIIDRIYLDMKVGLGDAALTALFYGLIKNLSVGLQYLLAQISPFSDIRFSSLPNFMETKLEIDLDCIINIKLGHIIITGIKIITRNIKGGDTIGRTPHRKYNDHYHGKH